VKRVVAVAGLIAACGGANASAPKAEAPVVSSASAPRCAAIAAAVRGDRMKGDVARLAAFGTRHTLSDTSSTERGIGAARAWIAAEMGRVPGVEVASESFAVPPDGKRIPRETEVVDVVGTLRGSMPEASARRYVVVGHYDSRVADVMDAASDAPGANDDASGVAVVLELGRVLAGAKLDATVTFLAVAGEEQALHGSRAFAKAARAKGLDVRAVLNDDIVGDPSSPVGPPEPGAIRVFSIGLPPGASEVDVAAIRKNGGESDSPSRELARFVADVAREEQTEITPRLVFRADRFLRGGDHLSFVEEGYPAAVRFTTPSETFARQHAPTDTPDFVDGAYLARVARLEAAVLVHLANAPSSPAHATLDTSQLANDTTVRWDASPEPDVAGYEVVWRATTELTWTHAVDVGLRREARVPVSKDDALFGVVAYDKDGWKSPATFAVADR
jgi:Zn-dependent M28 family amino/carboxypeptidase